MREFEFVTTFTNVKIYESSKGVFSALLKEVRELSRKKPDATLSSSKVKLVNSVLDDLLRFLKGEPEGKYLFALEDDALPQVSDALMMMVQFEAALEAFRSRYFQYVHGRGYFESQHFWITEEQISEWNEQNVNE